MCIYNDFENILFLLNYPTWGKKYNERKKNGKQEKKRVKERIYEGKN